MKFFPSRSVQIGSTFLVSLLFSAASLPTFAAQCPSTPDGTVITLSSLDPPPRPGEPAMSVTGLFDFAQSKGITKVADLLRALPAHYQKNYSLVERTRGAGKSSLQSPRIVLFGSDARFLMNISTDPTDPGYERVDMAFMDKNTGNWEFSQLNFATQPPSLRRNAAECTQCHGTPARPIWGTYLNWPGVFDDDPAPGDQAETLTPAHAQRFNQLKAGQGNPERFHTLKWAPSYQAGSSQFLPDHSYGFALTVFNDELGFTAAESVYLRMKTRFPQRFAALREELILLGYFDQQTRLLTSTERQRIAALITQLGGSGNRVENLFAVLGINMNNEFSLHKLASETPDPNWNAGSGNIHGLVMTLILNDLAQSDPNVRRILQSTPKGQGVEGIWACPDLGRTVWDVLVYRMTQGWKIKGAARQAVHEVFYPLDATRSFQPSFDRVATPLYQYLRTKISTTVP